MVLTSQNHDNSYKLVIFDGAYWLRANSRLFRTLEFPSDTMVLITTLGGDNDIAVVTYEASRIKKEELMLNKRDIYLLLKYYQLIILKLDWTLDQLKLEITQLSFL